MPLIEDDSSPVLDTTPQTAIALETSLGVRENRQQDA